MSKKTEKKPSKQILKYNADLPLTSREGKILQTALQIYENTKDFFGGTATAAEIETIKMKIHLLSQNEKYDKYLNQINPKNNE